MPRLISRPIQRLNIIPEPPKTLRGKIRQLLCCWFDHVWEKIESRAPMWMVTIEHHRCSRCGAEYVEELLWD